MIRAVKYAALTGFEIPGAMAALVRRRAATVRECSRERLTEEAYKILTSGSSLEILELAWRLRLFEALLPALAAAMGDRKRFGETTLAGRLRDLDASTREGRPLAREAMFGFLFRDLVLEREDLLMEPDPDVLVQAFIREASEPLFPSKKELALAAQSLLRDAGWQPPPPAPAGTGGPRRSRRRRRRPRRQAPPQA